MDYDPDDRYEESYDYDDRYEDEYGEDFKYYPELGNNEDALQDKLDAIRELIASMEDLDIEDLSEAKDAERELNNRLNAIAERDLEELKKDTEWWIHH